ncbi:MAG: histidine kinase [Bacteroidota bacterium]|nr:histidine kinase [Bacteroidota bacterium]
MFKNLTLVLLVLTSQLIVAKDIDKLISKFTFENGVCKDAMSNSSAKVYNASLVKDRFGNSNSAYFLHGNLGSYINLGSRTNLKPKIGSISLWVKIDHLMPNGIGVKINPIITTMVNEDDDFNEAYTIVYDITTKKVATNTTFSEEKQVSVYSADSIVLNEWHHLVVTYDNKFLSFYLDGALEGKMPKNFESRFLEGDSVIVGNLVTRKNKRFLNGAVDDIEIYGKVLNQKEVLSLYNAPNPNDKISIVKSIIVTIILIVLILCIIFFIKWRIRLYLKKELEKKELLNKSFEQDIKVLKAQMNPHFIFNSLNTILQFIIINDNGKAELYLTKFSKLLRKILETNTYEAISLTDEIEILNRYLEIESLRFNSVFLSEIKISKEIDPNETFIPHMLIQPFIENAIWHGLRTKEGEKQLLVKFELVNEKTLFCMIDDNGIGRDNINKSGSINHKNKSLGINFILQRLELLKEIHKMDYKLEMLDKVDEQGNSLGTTVEMYLPILKN